MKIIKASYEIMNSLNYDEILKHIELCGRICYKSEDKITKDSSERFARMLIKNGHEAMIEHCSFTIKFIVDRGVSHELVRHRLTSFAQESQRYCNYSKEKFDGEITFIHPIQFDTGMGLASNSTIYEEWKHACLIAESKYLKLMGYGAKPEEARTVLPNSTKTEVVMTKNIRMWRDFFRLRVAPNAHSQMREVTVPCLQELKEKLPVFFEDIEV